MFQLLLAIIYLSFISLGLPDGLLGAGWPSMYLSLNVPMSYAGIVSMIISAGTVISSLQSDRLTKKLGTGKITALSVLMTAIALLGFSFSKSFWVLCLWAVPYGLGAGSVDASINNYVALHYGSHHMSWLHCMWGVGAAAGPYVMGWVLTGGKSWHMGYWYIGIVQVLLSVILVISIPLWKERKEVKTDTKRHKEEVLTLRRIVKIPGAKEIMTAFFCYCAFESTAGLWASSYLVFHHGIDSQTAASYASMFYIGITIGRGLNGFLAMKLSDTRMIRIGMGIMAIGCLTLLLPINGQVALGGLILVGLGCAPIYPCVIHSTPAHFGEERSQALVGVQMASAYTGTCLMPPIFGMIASHISVVLFPVFLGLILLLMAVMYEKLLRRTAKQV